MNLLPLSQQELGAYTERIAPCWCITSAAKNPEGIFKYFIDKMLDGGDVQMLWTSRCKGIHTGMTRQKLLR